MVNKKINRYLWMVIFFVGIMISLLLEWSAKTASPMAWFLVTGIWSAVCGIGFTVTNTFVQTKPTTVVREKAEN